MDNNLHKIISELILSFSDRQIVFSCYFLLALAMISSLLWLYLQHKKLKKLYRLMRLLRKAP